MGAASGIRPIHRDVRVKQIPPFGQDDTKFIFGVPGEVALPRVATASALCCVMGFFQHVFAGPGGQEQNLPGIRGNVDVIDAIVAFDLVKTWMIGIGVGLGAA